MNYRRSYKVDIVIPVWNQAHLAYKCIESIGFNTPSDLYQITVIDNGSDKAPFDHWITNEFPLINLVHLPFNHGYIRATNIGMAMALLTDSEYILLMNSDVEIPDGDKDWLQRMIGSLEQSTKLGAVGAVSNNVFGYQRADKPIGTQSIRPASALIGFCLLLRKAAVMQVGLLDERFEPGNFDDFDYSIRLQEAGWKLAVAESVWVHHAMHASFKELDKQESFNDLLTVNQKKLADKWGAEQLAKVGLR